MIGCILYEDNNMVYVTYETCTGVANNVITSLANPLQLIVLYPSPPPLPPVSPPNPPPSPPPPPPFGVVWTSTEDVNNYGSMAYYYVIEGQKCTWPYLTIYTQVECERVMQHYSALLNGKSMLLPLSTDAVQIQAALNAATGSDTLYVYGCFFTVNQWNGAAVDSVPVYFTSIADGLPTWATAADSVTPHVRNVCAGAPPSPILPPQLSPSTPPPPLLPPTPPSPPPPPRSYLVSLDGLSCASQQMQAGGKHAEIIQTRGDCLDAVKWYNLEFLPLIRTSNMVGQLLSTYENAQLDHDIALTATSGIPWPGCYFDSYWSASPDGQLGTRAYFQDYATGDPLPSTLNGFTNICRLSTSPSPPPPGPPPPRYRLHCLRVYIQI
jgi:hypothetical protein